MQEELLKMIEREKAGDSSQVLPLVVEDIRRTAEYAADIAEIVINMNTEAIIRTEEGALVRAA